MTMDRLKSWYIRKVLKPEIERIDMPGYVLTDVGGANELREVFLPENLLVKIENQTVENLEQGEELLYRAGKRFGVRYAAASGFPTVETDEVSDVDEFLDFFVRYIQVLYASKVNYNLDTAAEKFSMEAENYSVCRKNGKGYLLTTGATAGVLAYVFSDSSVEATQRNCQGRDADKCKIKVGTEIFGPSGEKFDVNLEQDLDSSYVKINKPRKLGGPDTSLQDYLDKGLFRYEKGTLEYNDERLLPVEYSLLDIVADELSRRDSGQILRQSAYSIFSSFESSGDDKFAADLLAALGFGAVRSLDGNSFNIEAHPWTRFTEKSSLQTTLGMLEGLQGKGELSVMSQELSKDGFRVKLRRPE